MKHVLDAAAPLTLAKSRREGILSDLPLHEFSSRAQAEQFQSDALHALGGTFCGYKIGATSLEVQQLLSCREPIYAPIRREDVLAAGASFMIPAGLLGVECEYGFLMGQDFPGAGEALTIDALRSGIAGCFMALELVGRRVVAGVPLNEMSAIADFGLDVAAVCGASIPDWETRDLAAMPVRAVLNGRPVAEGNGAMVLGHPLNALLWLADALHQRGTKLRAGEMIVTGACCGITKVAAGETFAGCFADFPPLEIQLV
jgi:2-keto-4-pentenoate hydratase